MKAVWPDIVTNGVPQLQMMSVGSHSTSGRGKEGKDWEGYVLKDARFTLEHFIHDSRVFCPCWIKCDNCPEPHNHSRVSLGCMCKCKTFIVSKWVTSGLPTVNCTSCITSAPVYLNCGKNVRHCKVFRPRLYSSGLQNTCAVFHVAEETFTFSSCNSYRTTFHSVNKVLLPIRTMAYGIDSTHNLRGFPACV